MLRREITAVTALGKEAKAFVDFNKAFADRTGIRLLAVGERSAFFCIRGGTKCTILEMHMNDSGAEETGGCDGRFVKISVISGIQGMTKLWYGIKRAPKRIGIADDG